MIREQFSSDLKHALKARDARRVSTLRLITAALKDRDIAARTEGNGGPVPDSEILALLARMIRQRQESAKAYDEGGRPELADRERAEIAIIRAYLPRQMSEAEVEAAVTAAIAATGAASARDMGKVMAALKARHTGEMDFAQASAAVKRALG
ncbi:MAG TPA: GatB/YqeY domain-containing protein [Amaricoccus sp.]|nr:GatB/YqeY domain-containing protein [Amaricoccus sp.]